MVIDSWRNAETENSGVQYADDWTRFHTVCKQNKKGPSLV